MSCVNRVLVSTCDACLMFMWPVSDVQEAEVKAAAKKAGDKIKSAL